MKNTTILIATFFFCINSYSQKMNENLKFHAVDTGFGFFLNKNFGGISVHSGIALKNKNNLYAFTIIAGGELNVLGGTTASFEEYNLQYGRKLKLARWITFEGFTGIGYYNQNSSRSNVIDNNSLSFPLKLNTKINFSKRFGMGFMNNYSISKINNNLTTHLLFHYNFN
jgi:hypothetical protein